MNPELLVWYSIAASAFIKFLPFLTSIFLKKQLPSPTGKYKVGSFVTRVPQKHLIRFFFPTSKIAMGEETIAAGKWLPEFIYINGYARFLGFSNNIFLNYIMQSLRFVRGPWVDQTEENFHIYKDSKNTKLPVLLFSHGMGGSQTMYSIICTEMASKGFLVVVPEHMDGSASCTIQCDGSPLFSQVENDIEALVKRKEVLGNDSKILKSDKKIRDYLFQWRNGQSQIRVNEVFESILFTFEHPKLRHYIDKQNCHLCGHSFGCTSVLGAVARTGGNLKGFPTNLSLQAKHHFLRFKTACCLDGWMWPIVGDGDNTYLIDQIFGASQNALLETNTPILFIDADTFINDLRWRTSKIEIIERAQAYGRNRNLRVDTMLLSLKHSAHFTFSDVLVLGGMVYPILNQFRSKPQNLKNNTTETTEAIIPSQEELLFSIMGILYHFMEYYSNGVAHDKIRERDFAWRDKVDFNLYSRLCPSNPSKL